jgi:hypothetical protein
MTPQPSCLRRRGKVCVGGRGCGGRGSGCTYACPVTTSAYGRSLVRLRISAFAACSWFTTSSRVTPFKMKRGSISEFRRRQEKPMLMAVSCSGARGEGQLRHRRCCRQPHLFIASQDPELDPRAHDIGDGFRHLGKPHLRCCHPFHRMPRIPPAEGRQPRRNNHAETTTPKETQVPLASTRRVHPPDPAADLQLQWPQEAQGPAPAPRQAPQAGSQNHAWVRAHTKT